MINGTADFPTAEEFLQMQADEAGVKVEGLIMHHVDERHRLFGIDGAEAISVSEKYDMAIPADREAFKRAYDAEVKRLKQRMKKARH